MKFFLFLFFFSISPEIKEISLKVFFAMNVSKILMNNSSELKKVFIVLRQRDFLLFKNIANEYSSIV